MHFVISTQGFSHLAFFSGLQSLPLNCSYPSHSGNLELVNKTLQNSIHMRKRVIFMRAEVPSVTPSFFFSKLGTSCSLNSMFSFTGSSPVQFKNTLCSCLLYFPIFISSCFNVNNSARSVHTGCRVVHSFAPRVCPPCSVSTRIQEDGKCCAYSI